MIRKLRSRTYVLSYWAWASGWDTHPEVGKSDLIVIDCIDQSVEIDDTLVSFIHIFILIFTDFIDLYRKIHSVYETMKTEFMQSANLLRIELQLRVEWPNIYHCIFK